MKFQKGDIITCVDIRNALPSTALALKLFQDYKVKDCDEKRVTIHNPEYPIADKFFKWRFTLNKKAIYKNHMRNLIESAFD